MGYHTNGYNALRSRAASLNIEDIQRIYTFWKDNNGHCNPHKLYGYLNHPTIAKKLINWISDK
jgi:hypothetical protein